MIHHIIEGLAILLIFHTLGRWYIARRVKQSLCPDCNGYGRTPYLEKHRPCHTCHLRGYQ